MNNPLHRLTDEQIEALGREFDELHEEVKADLGDRDAAYIRGIIALHRRLGLIARMELLGAALEARVGARDGDALGWPRSSRTWRSATTSCTASGTG